MAFTLIQSGTTLQLLNTSGSLQSLSLPSDVEILSTLVPRFAVFGKFVVMVNSTNRPLIIDQLGTVRVLTPETPRTVPTLSAAGGGALTGKFMVRQSFVVLDDAGNVISESGIGPASLAAEISGSYLVVAGLDLSPDAVSASRLYRTTTQGAVYFKWIDLDGNTATTIQDDLVDASLALAAAPTLGSAPDLTYIAEWRGRLWGVSRTEKDHLRYTETGLMYSWPLLNDILVPREGSDTQGITALIARREVLGIGRRNLLWQVTGSSASDFRMVKISENVGVESQETVKINKDTAYFLWKDGVYQWDSSGIICISDNKVRSWFTTDTYFNRAKFPVAFAMIDPLRSRYMLFLCSAGSTTIDRWVEYDLEEKTWWGPHKTGAFTPSCALIVPDINDTLLPMIGASSGFLYQNQSTRTDDAGTAIDFDVDGKFHDGDSPDIQKFFGEMAIIDKVQSGGTLTITPFVGGLDATAGAAIVHDMTLGRQRLRRLGTGRMLKLNFRQNDVGQDVELFGYEIPFHELGRR